MLSNRSWCGSHFPAAVSTTIVGKPSPTFTINILFLCSPRRQHLIEFCQHPGYIQTSSLRVPAQATSTNLRPSWPPCQLIFNFVFHVNSCLQSGKPLLCQDVVWVRFESICWQVSVKNSSLRYKTPHSHVLPMSREWSYNTITANYQTWTNNSTWTTAQTHNSPNSSKYPDENIPHALSNVGSGSRCYLTSRRLREAPS